MGMDLVQDPDNAESEDLHYNWSGWALLKGCLAKWDVDLSEFSNSNDGEIISAETCRKVADAIEKHLHELPPEHQRWLGKHIEPWRYSKGFQQW